jgi:beta-glucosidase
MVTTTQIQETEDRVNNLLAQMTLDEKVGQMNQVNLFDETRKQAVRRGEIGSILNASSAWAGKDVSLSSNAEVCNACQHEAVDHSRLHIPLLFGRDVIHGYRTVFPIPLAQSASWHPALTEQAFGVAAREATADGIKWFFSPMLDIARDPRWGRIAEGFGEDSFLASAFARAAVRGIQGDDYAAVGRAVACPKHFVGYGRAEGGRDYDYVDMSERTLREVYLPPFRAALNAGAGTLMSAFHDFSGVPVSANRFLLTDVLRNEWGFDGLVVSDWAAVAELVVHGVAEDGAVAAQKAVGAGVDMDMVSETYLLHLAQLVRSGAVLPEAVDEAVRRILRVKFRAGLFDAPYTDPARAQHVMLASEHRALARAFAAECSVLLKNTAQMLPLKRERARRIVVCGPLAHGRAELFGTWTPDGRAEDVVSIADAMREIAPRDFQLIFPSDNPDECVSRAVMADAAVVIVGEHPSRSGEASSISTLDLPAGQRQLLEVLHDNGVPIVMVLLAGRPLAIGREVALADAVLYAWHPGVEGGYAIAEMLFGLAAPGGRLPVTFPRTVGQVPIYYNHRNTGRPAAKDVYSSRYIDLPIEPLFPFGYGLGYTRFGYADLHVQAQPHDGSFSVSADVTNAGDVAGTEVVQLYVRDLVGSVTRPVKELKGFERIALQPGETRRVTFHLQREQLAFIGLDGRPVIEPGKFQVWIGPNSAEGLQGEFTLK